MANWPLAIVIWYSPQLALIMKWKNCKEAVLYYTSWWDFVGIKIEIVGMDPNCYHPKPRPSTPHNFLDTSLFLYRKETWTFKSNFIPTKSHQVFSSAFHFICWSWDFGVINDWTTRMEKWKLTKTADDEKEFSCLLMVGRLLSIGQCPYQWYAEWYVEYIFSYASSFRFYPCQ